MITHSSQRLFFLVTLGFVLLTASAPAASVVSWTGSSGYVTANQTYARSVSANAFAYPSGTGRSKVLSWNESIALNPAIGANYSGTSAGFYGGLFASHDGTVTSAANITTTPRITENATADQLYYRFQTPADTAKTTVKVGGGLCWLKANFLNLNSSPITVDSSSSLSMTIVTLSSPMAVRWMVKDGSQWYVSSTSYTTTGSKTLSGAGLTAETWLAFDPATSMFEPAGSYAAHTFANITAVGYFGWATISGTAATTTDLVLNNFTADLAELPRPLTTTDLSSSLNPAPGGASVTFTATVQTNGFPAGGATGSVVFKDGATPLSTNIVSGGVATFSSSGLAPGAHAMTAQYLGDFNYAPSTSGNVLQLVGPTTTLLVASTNLIHLGSNVTFTATVQTNGITATAAIGSVVFRDAGVPFGTNVSIAGQVGFSTSALAVGPHSITALYLGDGNFAASTSTVVVVTVTNTGPYLLAPPNVTPNTDLNLCSASGVILGSATAVNFTPVTLTNNAPAIFANGVTPVVWTAIHPDTTPYYATQLVTVVDAQLPSLTAPPDLTNYVAIAQVPVINLNLGTPVASDNCTLASVTSNAPASFPAGLTLVTWTATDAAANSISATQRVVIMPGYDHPRLFFAPTNVAGFRAKANLAPWSNILNSIEWGLTNDYASTHKAGSYAALYLFQGNSTAPRNWADKARIAVLDLISSPNWATPTGSTALNRGGAGMQVSMAYDLCYDAWAGQTVPATFTNLYDVVITVPAPYAGMDLRAAVSLALKNNADSLIAGGGTGWPGDTLTANNWFGVRYSGAGMSYLACDETPSATITNNLNTAISKVKTYKQAGLGSGTNGLGWNVEGIAYAQYPGYHVYPFSYALKRLRGRDLVAEVPMMTYELWATYQGVLPIDRYSRLSGPGETRRGWGKGLRPDFTDDHLGWDGEGTAALAFAFAPPEYKPGLKWQFRRICGDLGDQTWDTATGNGLYTLLFYPDAVAEQNPADVWGLTYADQGYGMFAFRNRHQDTNDFVFQTTAKLRASGGGHFGADGLGLRLWGLNVPWLTGSGRTSDPRGQGTVFLGPPENTSSMTTPSGTSVVDQYQRASGDGTVVMNMTTTDTGVANHTRRIVVDYGTNSGAAATVIVSDSTGNGRYWRLNTPWFNTITTASNTFTFTSLEGHVLKGTILWPPNATLRTGTFTRGNGFQYKDVGYLGGFGHTAYIATNRWVDFESTSGQFVVAMTVTPFGVTPPAVLATGSNVTQTITIGSRVYALDGNQINVSGWTGPEVGLEASANPAALGSNVTFTATIRTNGVTAFDATGEVVFNEGGIALGTNAVSSGVATFSTSALALGTHSITAYYSGGGAYGASISSALDLLVVSAQPHLLPPANVTTNANPGLCSASGVVLGTATAMNFTPVTLTNDAPTTFAGGVTPVIWTAIDAGSTAYYATQQVTVVDVELPNISAPTNLTLYLSTNQVPVTNLYLGTPVASDNCTLVSVTSNAPASFPAGLTVVTWTATDAAANSRSAAQQVNIIVTNLAVVSTGAVFSAHFNNGTGSAGDKDASVYGWSAAVGSAGTLDATVVAGPAGQVGVSQGLALAAIAGESTSAGFLFTVPDAAPGATLLFTTSLATTNVLQDPQGKWFSGGSEPLTGATVAKLDELSVYTRPFDTNTTRMRFALRVDGVWYASTNSWIQTNNAVWEKRVVTVNASQWLYSIAVPGTSLHTNLTDNSVVTLNPAGIVSGYGVYADTAALATTDARVRIDSFAVTFVNNTSPVAVATTLALTSSLNPSALGSNVTFTASVQTNLVTAANATGNIVFRVGDTPMSTNVLTSGAASYITGVLPGGTNVVTAEYPGDSNYLGSTYSQNQVVTVPAAFNHLAVTGPVVGGVVNLNYVGNPGYFYALDRATNLGAPIDWLAVITNQASPVGALNFSVTNSGPLNFFRTRSVP